MEVLMRAIIRTFFVFSITVIFAASISHAQSIGVFVEAAIPFDFTIGNKTFAAGNYELSVMRVHGSVHSVLLRDQSGKVIHTATAIQNGSSVRGKADMLFAVVDGQRYLDKIRTQDCGFVFSKSSADKRIAKAKRVSVPSSGSTPN